VLVLLLFALAPPLGARAAVTIGSDLGPADQSITCASGGGCTIAMTSLPGHRVTSQIDGVIVRARMKDARAPAGSRVGIRVIRPLGGRAFRGGDSVEVPGRSCPDVCVERMRLPICARDYIGIDAPEGSMGGVRNTPGAELTIWSPYLAPGQTRPADLSGGYELLANVDIEADADKDGLGDETQDPDPTRASASRAPCPPPPVKLTLKLRYKAGHDHAGRLCVRNGGVRASVSGRDRSQIRRAAFRLGRRRSLLDRRPPFTRTIDRTRHRGHSHLHRVGAKVLMKDGRHLKLPRSLRFCAGE
jgi:hypothetical protein